MSAVMSGPRERGGASNRALAYAVAGSFVLHASLLALLSFERDTRREAAAPGPIVARLAASPEPSRLLQAAPQPEPPKPLVEPAPPKPAPKPIAKPAPVRKPSPAPPPARKQAPAPQAAPSPLPAPPATPAEPAPSPAPAPSPPAAIPRTDPSSGTAAAPSPAQGSIETYRMELITMMRRYKRYPRVAIDNNWEGTTVVRMVIGANGMIQSLTVLSSAGQPVLDKQALDMIRKAKPLVPIPQALRGREYPVDVPVIFELKDQASG